MGIPVRLRQHSLENRNLLCDTIMQENNFKHIEASRKPYKMSTSRAYMSNTEVSEINKSWEADSYYVWAWKIKNAEATRCCMPANNMMGRQIARLYTDGHLENFHVTSTYQSLTEKRYVKHYERECTNWSDIPNINSSYLDILERDNLVWKLNKKRYQKNQ